MRYTLAIILAVACGCGSPKLTFDVAQHPDAGVRGYRTYRWKHPAADASEARLQDLVVRTDWAVRRAVQERMATKGYAGPSQGEADLILDYDIVVRKKTTDSFRELLAYKASGGTKDWGESYMDGFEHGTLTLQVADPRRGQVIWQGAASGVVDPRRSGRNIPRAVNGLLERFPDAR